MKNLHQKIKQKLLCLLGFHKWTCNAEKGIKPNKGQDFWDYALMYCDYCGKFSKLNYI